MLQAYGNSKQPNRYVPLVEQHIGNDQQLAIRAQPDTKQRVLQSKQPQGEKTAGQDDTKTSLKQQQQYEEDQLHGGISTNAETAVNSWQQSCSTSVNAQQGGRVRSTSPAPAEKSSEHTVYFNRSQYVHQQQDQQRKQVVTPIVQQLLQRRNSRPMPFIEDDIEDSNEARKNVAPLQQYYIFTGRLRPDMDIVTNAEQTAKKQYRNEYYLQKPIQTPEVKGTLRILREEDQQKRGEIKLLPAIQSMHIDANHASLLIEHSNVWRGHSWRRGELRRKQYQEFTLAVHERPQQAQLVTGGGFQLFRGGVLGFTLIGEKRGEVIEMTKVWADQTTDRHLYRGHLSIDGLHFIGNIVVLGQVRQTGAFEFYRQQSLPPPRIIARQRAKREAAKKRGNYVLMTRLGTTKKSLSPSRK